MTAALLIVVLLCAVTGLSFVAKRINVPYPVAFVIGGVALVFIPGLPPMVLDPPFFS
jgi:CPA1 family monovalent cation:H+ antiporter